MAVAALSISAVVLAATVIDDCQLVRQGLMAGKGKGRGEGDAAALVLVIVVVAVAIRHCSADCCHDSRQRTSWLVLQSLPSSSTHASRAQLRRNTTLASYRGAAYIIFCFVSAK